jgi:hypothetical protein
VFIFVQCRFWLCRLLNDSFYHKPTDPHVELDYHCGSGPAGPRPKRVLNLDSSWATKSKVRILEGLTHFRGFSRGFLRQRMGYSGAKARSILFRSPSAPFDLRLSAASAASAVTTAAALCEVGSSQDTHGRLRPRGLKKYHPCSLV